MKKIKKIKPKGLYVFQGKACAKNSIIRDLAGAKELIESANERFRGYMKIRKYCISQDSWTFLVEILDKKSIKRTYLAARSRSKKAKKGLEFEEYWRIVSECIRHWLSRFVRWTNAKDERAGSLRMKSYEKFLFESFEEASSYVEDMVRQRMPRSQKNGQFRASKKKWKLHKIGVGHIFLCAGHVDKGVLEGVFGAGSLELIDLNADVLRRLIISTLKRHFSFFKHPFKPKIK